MREEVLREKYKHEFEKIPIKKKRESSFNMSAWPQNWRREVLKVIKSSSIKGIRDGT